MEASGTSGMKAAMNGDPIASASSTAGGTRGSTGATAGPSAAARRLADDAAQDEADADELYRLLEEEVVPRFFARDGEGLPGEWIGTMREAIAAAIWQFSTARMLGEYVEKLYRPAVRAAEPATAGSA